jgi:hypothetical protein
MGLNEANPLAFIRSKIPDTATADRAASADLTSKTGIQRLKDIAAGKRNDVTADTARGNANVVAGFGRNTPETKLAEGLANIRYIKAFKDSMSGLDSGRGGGLMSTAPQGSQLADIIKPKGGFNQVDLKGVAQAKQMQEVVTGSDDSKQEEFFEPGPDGKMRKVIRKSGTNQQTTNKNNPESARIVFNQRVKDGSIVHATDPATGRKGFWEIKPDGTAVPVEQP